MDIAERGQAIQKDQSKLINTLIKHVGLLDQRIKKIEKENLKVDYSRIPPIYPIGH